MSKITTRECLKRVSFWKTRYGERKKRIKEKQFRVTRWSEIGRFFNDIKNAVNREKEREKIKKKFHLSLLLLWSSGPTEVNLIVETDLTSLYHGVDNQSVRCGRVQNQINREFWVGWAHTYTSTCKKRRKSENMQKSKKRGYTSTKNPISSYLQ